jgi:hypothetical protein
VRRITIAELPTEENLTSWTYNLYAEKDALIAEFHTNNKGWGKGRVLPVVSGWEHLSLLALWSFKWITPPALLLYTALTLYQ